MLRWGALRWGRFDGVRLNAASPSCGVVGGDRPARGRAVAGRAVRPPLRGGSPAMLGPGARRPTRYAPSSLRSDTRRRACRRSALRAPPPALRFSAHSTARHSAPPSLPVAGKRSCRRSRGGVLLEGTKCPAVRRPGISRTPPCSLRSRPCPAPARLARGRTPIEAVAPARGHRTPSMGDRCLSPSKTPPRLRPQPGFPATGRLGAGLRWP
jgi:hypothetical protein